MASNLIDANQPAHAIVEEYDTGGAKRNDGTELKPANENPWYVLATVYGEQAGSTIDRALHAKNRRIWNGWMCANLDDYSPNEIAQQLGVNVAELATLETDERNDLNAAFGKRLGDRAPPDPRQAIDFRYTNFPTSTVLDGLLFPEYTTFQFARFRVVTRFISTLFMGLADFKATKFDANAVFNSAVFSDLAEFEWATSDGAMSFTFARFRGFAVFRSVTFGDHAYFASAKFGDFANFQSATFTGHAVFKSARFSDLISFSNGAFQARTDFKNAIFQSEVPEFFQCGLHEDTIFTLDDRYWPRITSDKAAEGKSAYTRLRQAMNEFHKPDDEHFFFRQEMRCKAKLENWPERSVIWLYGFLSDFGYSVARPAGGLLGMWLGPALVYLDAPLAKMADKTTDLSCLAPFGLSFANLFAFFGLNRLYFEDVIAGLGPWLSILAGAQTVLGVILVFFLGLGLRNRFRLQ